MDKMHSAMAAGIMAGQTPAEKILERNILNEALNPGRKEYPAVAQALKNRQNNVEVIDFGRVTKVLSDRETGAPGVQIFYLKTDSGPLVQVYHVRTISPEIPDLKAGLRMGVKGNFILNDEKSRDKFAGIINATHKDPEGKREDGGIVLLEKDKNYGKVIS